jgi:hypothetical protein
VNGNCLNVAAGDHCTSDESQCGVDLYCNITEVQQYGGICRTYDPDVCFPFIFPMFFYYFYY